MMGRLPVADPARAAAHNAPRQAPAPDLPAYDNQTALALGTYVKLLRAARAIDARVEPGIVAAGLTPTQLGVLEALLHKGTLTQVELGRKLLTSPGNMTDVIDKLERRGLVLRGRKPGDRRAVRVDLTDAGRAKISELFPRHAAAITAAMAGLSAAELETLGGLLRTLGRTASGTWRPPATVEDAPDPLAEEYGLSHLRGRSFDIE